MNQEDIARIKLFLIPGIGHLIARHLITYADSAINLFQLDKKTLYQIPGLGKSVADNILRHDEYESRAKDEIAFLEKEGCEIIHFDDQKFPYRLNESPDPPFFLFKKGSCGLNENRMISIVGTRKATHYGKNFIEQLLKELKPYHVTVVSGLAYGTDIHAHRICLAENIPTIGVVAHGLDRLYPHAHKATAKEMQSTGALLTDFLCHTKPDRENFPKRNRIIAGLCDATIVIEAAKKGGALITGNLAFDYNRSVFALPGRRRDIYSEGCNNLIKRNRAQLITEPNDIIDALGWEKQSVTQQTNLFDQMNEEQRKIMELIRNGNKYLGDLSVKAQVSFTELQTLLFEMEMNEWIKQLPGNRVELVG